jgi:hypothetical protein
MSLQQTIEQYLPKWFSLDKYDPCASMSLEAWRHAIRDRQDIQFSLYRGENSCWSGGFSRSIELLFKDSISKLGGTYVAQPKSYPGRDRFDSEFPDEALPVAPLTVESVFQLAGAALDTAQGGDQRDYLLNDQVPKSYYEAREYWGYSKTPVDDILNPKKEEGDFWEYGPLAHLQVDLSSSEEDLSRSFAEYIKVMKQKYSLVDEQSSLLRESAFKKYHKHRVLPYIDLMLWFEYKEVSITHQQMGLILFPNQYDKPLDDRIRRTVKPLAEELLSLEFY